MSNTDNSENISYKVNYEINSDPKDIYNNKCINYLSCGIDYIFNCISCRNKFGFIKKTLFVIFKSIILLIMLSAIHWTSVTMYYYWCHEKSYMGIITNMFVVGSPICLALNKLQIALSENYIAFVVSCGVGFGMVVKGIIG